MKKRVFLVLLFGIFFIALNLKLSYAVGLRPALLNIKFEPGVNYSITYSIYEEDPEREVEIFAEGELAKYVELDKKSIKGGGGFNLIFRMPDKVDTPGPNIITIGVREKPGEEGGVGTATAINGALIVFVPYPGKYMDIIDFNVRDVNLGQPVDFGLIIVNHGWENITAKAELEIYRENKKIDTIVLGEKFLETHQEKTFKKQIDSNKYGAGAYNASVSVYYGDPNRIPRTEKTFRIGSLLVDITNWTKEFYTEQINRFIVEVESNWNNLIEKVYANVLLYDAENKSILAEFKTTPESLDRWNRKNLTGHLEAYDIKPGIYKTNITVFYETTSTTKIVDIIGRKKINITLIIIIAAAIALVILLLTAMMIRHKRQKAKRR